MDRRDELPRTRKFILGSLLPEIQKSGGFGAFSLRKHAKKICNHVRGKNATGPGFS